jgi:hypothetical protein
MTEQKRKFVNYSPVGTLVYPRLNKPDEFRGKSFYKAVVLLDPKNEEVQAFVEKLDTHVFNKLDKGDYRPLKTNADGMLELTVKRKADFGPPRFFLPTGERSSEEIDQAPGLIWGGTEASVSFTAYNYTGGVTFALTGVTIHKLVEPEEKKSSAGDDVKKIFDT